MLKNMKGLYKFHFDCGRMGELVGLFTQKEALMIRNKFVLDNNLVERVGILEYEGE